MEKLPDTMLKVPAGEFQRNISRYQDLALIQPVAVTRNGRERTVLISPDKYQQIKRRDRQALNPFQPHRGGYCRFGGDARAGVIEGA